MNRFIEPVCQATLAGGIDAIESISGLLKSLKHRALFAQLYSCLDISLAILRAASLILRG